MEGPEFITSKTLKEKETDIWEKQMESKISKTGEKSKIFVPKSAAQLINNKRSQNFRGWLYTAL